MTYGGGAGGADVFVIDTSSVIQVRQVMSQATTPKVTAVYARLIALAQRGVCVSREP